MREDVVVTKFAQYQLRVVGVSRKVLQGMESLSKQISDASMIWMELPQTAQRFKQITLLTLSRPARVDATEMYGSTQAEFDIASARRPASTFIGDVVLHA